MPVKALKTFDVTDVAALAKRREFPRGCPGADAEHVVQLLAGDDPAQADHLVLVGRTIVADAVDGGAVAPELRGDLALELQR